MDNKELIENKPKESNCHQKAQQKYYRKRCKNPEYIAKRNEYAKEYSMKRYQDPEKREQKREYYLKIKAKKDEEKQKRKELQNELSEIDTYLINHIKRLGILEKIKNIST